MIVASICIPVLAPAEALAGNVLQMLASERTDFEILIADFTGCKLAELSKLAEAARDTRLRIVAANRQNNTEPAIEASAAWNEMAAQARGEWICFIDAADYADPEICTVIDAMMKRVPDADALSWGRARYVPPALRQGSEIARIPTGSRMILPEQKDMMRNQFYWDSAGEMPECHFGVWHGAVRRGLLERIREAFSDVWFEQAAPDIDNICKTVMLARRMVFWERPLSVQSAAMAPVVRANPAGQPFGDFPFCATTGAVASAALTIEVFKRRYGIELEGWEDNFIKACARDCETAPSGEQFQARKSAYANAIMAWRGKRALAAFRPEFKRKPKLPRFQGVREQHLHFDMAMDHTQTAADFYRLIDAVLFPVDLLDDKLA